MKKKILFLLFILFIGTIEVSAATFENVGKATTTEAYPIFDTLKVEDGYVLFTNNQAIMKINQNNEIEWIKELNISTNGGAPNSIQISKTKAMFAMCSSTVLINPQTGDLLKKEDTLQYNGVAKIGENYILYPKGLGGNQNNKISIVDEELNVLYNYNSESYIIDVLIEDNKVYVFSENELLNDEYTYTITTLDNQLNIIESQDYSLEDKKYISIAMIANLIKIDNDFYYCAHKIYKLSSDGIITHKLGNVDDMYMFYGNKLENALDYSSIKKIGDYLVTAGYRVENGEEYAFIEIFDYNFNSLKLININEEFNLTMEKGFSVAKNLKLTNDNDDFLATGEFRDTSNYTSTGFIIEYDIVYDINTKTDGNGEIKATTSSKSGEAVTFEVTPKEGFVLGVVKVKDANGNVVYFTSNTFTMPSSDVTIEATFLPKNPDTKDIAILLLLLLVIVGGIVFIKNRKKLNALK